MYIHNAEFVTLLFTGFQKEASKFFIFTLQMSLTSISATSVTLAISAGTNTMVVATILLSFVIIFSMIGKICLTIIYGFTFLLTETTFLLIDWSCRVRTLSYHSPYDFTHKPKNLYAQIIYETVACIVDYFHEKTFCAARAIILIRSGMRIGFTVAKAEESICKGITVELHHLYPSQID